MLMIIVLFCKIYSYDVANVDVVSLFTLCSHVLPPNSWHMGFDLFDPFWNVTNMSVAVQQSVRDACQQIPNGHSHIFYSKLLVYWLCDILKDWSLNVSQGWGVEFLHLCEIRLFHSAIIGQQTKFQTNAKSTTHNWKHRKIMESLYTDWSKI